MKFTFIMIFLWGSQIAVSQNLTLDQVIALRTKSLAYVEEYLTARKWEMLEAEEPTLEKMGGVTFTYNKSSFDDKAESFLYYLYSDNSNTKRLSIQVNKLLTYNAYMARLKALGYKLQKTLVEDGGISKVYQAGTTIIKVNTGTVDNYSSTKTIYSFLICNAVDYKQTFED